jgi:hypothetical protein
MSPCWNARPASSSQVKPEALPRHDPFLAAPEMQRRNATSLHRRAASAWPDTDGYATFDVAFVNKSIVTPLLELSRLNHDQPLRIAATRLLSVVRSQTSSVDDFERLGPANLPDRSGSPLWIDVPAPTQREALCAKLRPSCRSVRHEDPGAAFDNPFNFATQ